MKLYSVGQQTSIITITSGSNANCLIGSDLLVSSVYDALTDHKRQFGSITCPYSLLAAKCDGSEKEKTLSNFTTLICRIMHSINYTELDHNEPNN